MQHKITTVSRYIWEVYHKKYFWDKYHLIREDVTNNYSVNPSAQAIYIYYTNTVTINRGQNPTATFSNWQSTAVDVNDDLTFLRGKYFYKASESSDPADGDIKWVPTDATSSQGRLSSVHWVGDGEGGVVTLTAFLNSITQNAYPQNGWVANDYYYGLPNITQTITDPDVSSRTNDYPANGWQGDYHYLLKQTPGTSVNITDDYIYGAVTYTQETNHDTNDLQVGTDSCAEIKFTTTLLDSSSIGDLLTYYIKEPNDGSTWRKIGVFEIVNAEKDVYGKFKITAYDNIYKFNKIIDSWWTAQFPEGTEYVYLYALYASLCTYCGMEYNATNYANFTNRTYKVRKNFQPSNVTGRTILSYMADIAGGFACADADGKICLKGYTQTNKTMTANNYSTIKFSDFTTPVINGVSVQLDDQDTPIVYPSLSTGNLLRITGNPLLVYTTTYASELNTCIANIYNAVKDYTYVPMEFSMFEDYGVNAGDIISVTYMDDGTSTTSTCLVMSKTVSATGVKFTCYGQSARSVQSNYTSENIEMLRGYYSRVKQEVNQISAEVGNLQTDISTTVKLKADGVTITDHDGNTVTITGQCVDAQTLNASQINVNNMNFTGRIAYGDLTSNVKSRIETSSYEPPNYIKNTYIDASQVQSFTIKAGQGGLVVQNGALQIASESGATTYGIVGLSTWVDDNQVEHPGITLSNSSVSSLQPNDNYVFVYDDGIRMQVGDYLIYMDNTGAYYQEPNENPIKLGYARFG